jgi:hypothetical protein
MRSIVTPNWLIGISKNIVIVALPVWAKLQREVQSSFQGWDKHMDLKTLYYKTTRNIMTIWKDCE